jgi:hypothetical protein
MKKFITNGWQRAWFFAACIWLIPSAWWILQNFPTEAEVFENVKNKQTEESFERRKLVESKMEMCAFFIDKDSCYQNVGTDEKNYNRQNFHEKYLHAVAIELAELPKKQTQKFLSGLALWLLPLLALYALGFGVAWVRAGFKNQSTNQ